MELKTFEKIGNFELNKKPSKTLICKKILKKENRIGGHVYALVVNNVIKKIGCSVTKISNFAGYEVGNGGQPSDRTTGIHYYIAQELLLGNKVEFWISMCPKIENVQVTDLYGNSQIIESFINEKTYEQINLKSYYKKHGTYPEWNKQEQGRKNDWCDEIKQITISLKTKKSIPYDASMEYGILMKLYHWKHNNIDIFTLDHK